MGGIVPLQAVGQADHRLERGPSIDGKIEEGNVQGNPDGVAHVNGHRIERRVGIMAPLPDRGIGAVDDDVKGLLGIAQVQDDEGPFVTDTVPVAVTVFVTVPDEIHLVPLAKQSSAILEELHPLTGEGKLVFPGPRSRVRAISDMTLTAAIRRMGYSSRDLHVHGFRAMARTMIREQLNVNPEVIERQLSHAVDNPLGKAYDRTSFIPERREMMQWWADYLDELKH